MKKQNSDIRYPVQVVSGLSEGEHLFCLMVAVLGYSATRAYILAISPDIRANSAAAMSCRLMTERRIQNHIYNLYRWHETFVFNESAIRYQ